MGNVPHGRRDGEQWTDKGYVSVEPTCLARCSEVRGRVKGAQEQAGVREREEFKGDS